MKVWDAMSTSPSSKVVDSPGNTAAVMTDVATCADHTAWNDIINFKLIEWGRNPGELEDEGFDPPSPEAVRVACRLAAKMRDNGMPVPTFAVPDGDGGISFENRSDEDCELIKINRAGVAEFISFSGFNIAYRRAIEL